MRLPNNEKFPFFAYGLFKPGQLCFFRIKDFVKSTSETEVNGILKERDGIPLLVPSKYSKIKGILIHFHSDRETEAYESVVAVEPKEVYHWGEVIAGEGIRANALLGKRGDRGSSDLEHWESWDGRNDPFFKDALEEIESVLLENSQLSFDDFRPLFRLQMAYMLLWTSLERYASFKYHLGKKVAEKVYQIAEEKVFADSLKNFVKEEREVYSTADLEKYRLDPNDPEKSIRYYYQVRSNTVHRGKAVTKDFHILKSSLEELLPIFKELLEDAWNMRK
jgi:hypothetical protein